MKAREACNCGGSGVKQITTEQFGPSGETISTGWSTTPCQCRRGLPPRDGEASWWSTETVFDERVVTECFSEVIEASVRAEVPYDADNYRVHRHGNRYYPCSVDLAVSDPELRWLFPEEARAIAAMLVRAADAADAIDKPDRVACGHWAPCDCGDEAQERAAR